MMQPPMLLHIALPVERSTLPEPHTGIAIAETGELMLCAGTELHTLKLDAEGWAWLANLAAGLAIALVLEKNLSPAEPRPAAPALAMQEVAGHA